MDSHLARPRWRTTSLLVATLLAALVPNLAHAGPREDMKAAYTQALGQANELEYDAALGTINGAISAAEAAGAGQDPVLASLYVLRAALNFSLEGAGAKDKVLADLKLATKLNYYVVVPVEMRSDDLNKYLDQARKSAGAAPTEKIAHKPPSAACGVDLKIEALLGVPDGGQAALYWRPAGAGEFQGAEMPAFSNVAEAVIPAAGHADGNVEYFIYAFDASNNAVANLGTQDQPLLLQQTCAAEPDPVGPGDGPEPDEPVEPDKPDKPEGKPSALPRVWINIGLGTGLGIARGTAENTYQQYFPGSQAYGPREAGCAIARWYAGTGDVTALQGPELAAAFATYGDPNSVDEMMAAYNPDACAKLHPVKTGMAIAPFHIAPEVSVRIGKRMSLGLFSRLQVVSGAKMFREDPTKELAASFTQDVRNPNPGGVKQKPPFSWTAGIKFKYFLGKDEKKFRPFIGAFAGYGTARLRVDMGFSNDRNGNSVPDSLEVGQGNDGTGNCTPVWPYNAACGEGLSEGDNLLAATVRANADSANRIDVVRIGSGFLGALVGFNYQIHKNFGFFGELDIGAFFPDQTSVLFDLTVGPSITF